MSDCREMTVWCGRLKSLTTIEANSAPEAAEPLPAGDNHPVLRKRKLLTSPAKAMSRAASSHGEAFVEGPDTCS